MVSDTNIPEYYEPSLNFPCSPLDKNSRLGYIQTALVNIISISVENMQFSKLFYRNALCKVPWLIDIAAL